MATQTLEFDYVAGQTLTAKLFPVDSDTQVGADAACTEAANRDGLYTCQFTDVPAGQYKLRVYLGGVFVASFIYQLTLTTATFREVIAEPVVVKEFTAAAMAQLATKRAFYVASPLLQDGTYEIVRGQDCNAVDGLSLDLPNPAGQWTDLTGAEVYLTARDQSGAARYTLAGTVVTPTGTGQKVRGEPDASWTQQLEPGQWSLEFEAILPGSGRVIPLGQFPLTVKERFHQP